MTHAPLVSIVINNYNYGPYLSQAIESALAQAYPNIEVIVIDDGSTDGSFDVLRSFAGRPVRVLTKPNGGQASSLNVGFSMSAGDFVCFLDSDDALLPTAIAEARAHAAGNVVKVHWPLFEVDANGARTGRIRPDARLSHGDLRATVVANGPEAITYPPTSGNLWARSFLARVFPLPEAEGFRFGGSDTYLSNLAPLYGLVTSVEQPQGVYRVHGKNNYSSLRFEAKLKQNLWGFEQCCRALADHSRAVGMEPDVERWRSRSWLYRFVRAREELASLVPAKATVMLVDDAGVGVEVVSAKTVVPFRERCGEYWGPPSDDVDAVFEFERLRLRGVDFAVFAWPAFWWLDHYTGFRTDLERRFRCVLKNDRLVVFDVRAERHAMV
jgi:Glycosyl transferase family 2